MSRRELEEDREALQLSKRQFADVLGVSRGQYYKWDIGLFRPSQKIDNRIRYLLRLKVYGQFRPPPLETYGKEYFQERGM